MQMLNPDGTFCRSCSNCGGQRHDKGVVHAPSGGFGLGSSVKIVQQYVKPEKGELRAEVCRDCGRVELFMELGEAKED